MTKLLALAGGFEAVQEYWHKEAVECLTRMDFERIKSLDLTLIQCPLEVSKSGLEFGFAGIHTHPKPFTLTDMSIIALYVPGFKEYRFQVSIPDDETEFWQNLAKKSIHSLNPQVTIKWEDAIRLMIRNQALLEAEKRYSNV